MDLRARPETRRLYFWFLVAVFIILALVRFLLFPAELSQSTLKLTTGSILDGLLTAAATTIIAALGYWYFILPAQRVDADHVHPSYLTKALKLAADDATEWSLKARTAKYFTREILPIIARNRASIRVRVQLLDPGDQTLMRKYTEFRAAHPGAAAWNAVRVEREIFGSLLLIALYKKKFPALDAEVRLSSSFWVLSIDCTGDSIFVCGQNKGDSALLYKRGQEYFDHYREEFEAGYKTSRIIVPEISNYDLDDLRLPLTAQSRSAIKDMFAVMGFSLEDSEIEGAVQAALGDHHYV
ncbi:hypothetical protein [Rhodococcoides fascians]|uniref:hypothetical protein n=1 Tax=Rhodococcoides fascians TaxID=1828 RepID=UPI0012D2EEF5|nr:hypothetical protein [Rhodococcus fascians]